jgi:squalene-hopene/tetraprenyl-beta-curcumene cyclase
MSFFSRLAALPLLAACPAVPADWNARQAADYLDAKQNEWFAWKPAAASGGPCVSCHTGITYLLARPALRRVLTAEKAVTPYETGMVDGLRSRLTSSASMFPGFTREPLASQARSVEAVIAAFSLTASPDLERALDRMWSLQLRSGPLEGAWPWFSLNLDPWETEQSPFYGATLAAVAAARAPKQYLARPEIRGRTAALANYLRRDQASQPLHNRLMLLWAASKSRDLLPKHDRNAIVAALRQAQLPNGAWTLDSLGPWRKRDAAPPSEGPNAYATALATFVLLESGAPRTGPRLQRALDWLAESMNKTYPPGSLQSQFMTDAATAFAVLALTH